MLIGVNGPALSVLTTLMWYLAWGMGTLLIVLWGAAHFKKKQKEKRLRLALIWFIVIAVTASTLNLICSHRMYSRQKWIIFLAEFTLLFSLACVATYRSVRSSRRQLQRPGERGQFPMGGPGSKADG